MSYREKDVSINIISFDQHQMLKIQVSACDNG